jgi:hypothetical protein
MIRWPGTSLYDKKPQYVYIPERRMQPLGVKIELTNRVTQRPEVLEDGRCYRTSRQFLTAAEYGVAIRVSVRHDGEAMPLSHVAARARRR